MSAEAMHRSRESQVVRVFVSSTFDDMHAERDHLNQTVFPEIRSRCLRRGVEFLGVDLRWGITRREDEEQGVLALCLAKIDRCPYFLGLLGDRYGWVPPPDDIPHTVFEEARQREDLPCEVAAYLDECYQLDTTVQLPVYRLRRDQVLPENVTKALIDFWEMANLPDAGTSITAREIARALSQNRAMGQDARSRALFYLRQLDPDATPELPRSFVPVFVEQDPKCQIKLVDLKRSLCSQPGLTVRPYNVQYAGLRIDPTLLPEDLSSAERDFLQDGVVQPEEWAQLGPQMRRALDTHGTVALDGLEEWGARVLEDLWSAIEDELGAVAMPQDAHEREREYHERFLAERTDLFYGREGLLSSMLAYVEDKHDDRLLAVTGAPGSGKSALMAECARCCRERFVDALVLPHFIGVSPGSTELTAMLRSLCESLRRGCAVEEEIPVDPDELRHRWPVFLQCAGSTRPVVLLLDAINQLDPTSRSQELGWLPLALPRGVHVLVSTLAGPGLDCLKMRLPEDHVLHIPTLPKKHRRMLILEHLDRRGKRLTRDQMDRLLDTEARPEAGLPLYLHVALEELCLFGIYEELDSRIDALPKMLPTLFDQVLARLEQNHGRRQTELILCWLAVSRSGMLEPEILELLERNEPGFTRIHWTRFYRSLEFYLQRVEETKGIGFLGFYHDQLRLAVYRRYLQMDRPEVPPSDAFRQAHQELASYFRSVACQQGEPPVWLTDRTRGLSELPYHQARGALWDDLRQTLTDLNFLEAKCLTGMAFDLLNDYSDALSFRQIPTLIQMQRALALVQPTLSDRPELTVQSVYNRLVWFDSLEPELRVTLEKARQNLDGRGCWICAEAPMPRVESSIPLAMAFGSESYAQSMSADGRTIAVATVRGEVEGRDLTDNGRLIYSDKLPNPASAIALGIGAESLITMDADGVIRSEQGNTCLAGRKGEDLMVFHPRHGVLAVREDHALVWWNLESEAITVLARDLPSPLIVLDLSHNGHGVLFVAGYRDQVIGISTWNGKSWVTRLLPHTYPPVVDACLDLENRHILLATIDRRLSIFDLGLEECLAGLFYERCETHIRGKPEKCALGTGPTRGCAFFATDTGQIAGWDWSQDRMELLEPYRSSDERAVLVLMVVLPSSGELLVTTNSQARIARRTSSQEDLGHQEKTVSACWLTTRGEIVSASERGHRIRWFSSKGAEGLVILGSRAIRFPTALAQGAELGTVLVGNRAGEVWSLGLDTDPAKKLLLHLRGPVVSLFFRAVDGSVVAATKSGDVVHKSLTHQDYKKWWHSTGYQTRIKILPAGNQGLFWSLHRDEKLGNISVLSLVRDVDQEEVILSDPSFRDLAVAPDRETVCVAGRDVQILQLHRRRWRCSFRRQEYVDGVCFLGKDRLFLVVVLGDRLEVWKVAPELPTVASIDLRPMQVKVTCLHTEGDRIIAGCRSGDLMWLRFHDNC